MRFGGLNAVAMRHNSWSTCNGVGISIHLIPTFQLMACPKKGSILLFLYQNLHKCIIAIFDYITQTLNCVFIYNNTWGQPVWACKCPCCASHEPLHSFVCSFVGMQEYSGGKTLTVQCYSTTGSK